MKMATFAHTTALTLYGYHGSSTTNRIRLALAFKNIPYKFVEVDEGPANEQRSEQWKSTMNSLGQIPVLKVNQDIVLRQSVAVCEYLGDAFPESPSLLPEDPIARARVREVVEIVNSYIQPMQNKLTVEKIAKMDPDLAAWLPIAVKAHIEGGHEHEVAPVLWPHEWIMKGLASIEKLIDDGEAFKFCFGNKPTLADCALVPQVIGAKKYMVDMSLYPNCVKVHDNVLAMEEVHTTMADVIATL